MSNTQSGFEPPVANAGNIPPKKSGNKLWLFGGIGCLLLSLLCVGGIAIVAYTASGPIMAAMAEIGAGEALIQSSPEVQEEIGTPITVTRKATDNNNQTMIVKGDVSGPEGSGTYSVELSLEATEEGISFETKSITVDVNGKTIEVEDDLGDIEDLIDMGDMGEVDELEVVPEPTP